MSLKFSAVAVAVWGVLLAGVAAAEEQGNSAGVVNAGAFEIKPRLVLAVGKNDNVGLTGVKTASNFTRLDPSIEIGLPTHGQRYSAMYAGSYMQFSGSGIDNYRDHKFGLSADNVWNSRVNSSLDVDYVKGHDGRNALMFRNKELWHTTGLKGMVHYGAGGAQGQFELAAGQWAKRYDSNNGGATQFYNHDKTDLTGTFFYKVAPATKMFVEVGTAKFAYVDAASKRLDSTEQHYMLGVKWDATAKTTGSFKIGKLNKSFSLGLLPSGTATVWDGAVTWAPMTYSVVDASLRQRSNEYGGVGSFIVSRDADLKWKHDWSKYVVSTLSFNDGVDNFQATNRVDKRQGYGAKLSYGINRWLNAGVEYQHSKRNSTDARLSYTQSVSMLLLEGSL
ncbi:MAG: outer membrane beta-barrel protein [Gallionella sp.]|nr:outer membrane beta-barrel protein [Gallionella sp.]